MRQARTAAPWRLGNDADAFRGPSDRPYCENPRDGRSPCPLSGLNRVDPNWRTPTGQGRQRYLQCMAARLTLQAYDLLLILDHDVALDLPLTTQLANTIKRKACQVPNRVSRRFIHKAKQQRSTVPAMSMRPRGAQPSRAISPSKAQSW